MAPTASLLTADATDTTDVTEATPSHHPNERASRHPPPPKVHPMHLTAFLTVGQMFSGSQTVNNNAAASSPSPLLPVSAHVKDLNEWRVNVVIQGVNLARGTVCGSMEALDVPKADAPVVTFWTGEIIDNINYFFRTRRWGAHIDKDVEHWERFVAFAPLQQLVANDAADEIDLSQSRYVFMRWKEIFFVSPGEDCGLTIAGFYYVCMDRHTGAVLGYYFDPYCHPFQRLQLNAVSSKNGYCFADYKFN